MKIDVKLRLVVLIGLLFLGSSIHAQEYLLDSTTTLVFLPPASGSVDFSKHSYDNMCRETKKETKDYKEDITYDGNLQTTLRTDKMTGLPIITFYRKYNDEGQIITEVTENQPAYYRIDSFFYDQDQRLIGRYVYLPNLPSELASKTDYKFEGDLLTMKSIALFNELGTQTSYDSTRYFYNSQENEILRINKSNNYLETIDSIRSEYNADNELHFEFLTRYNGGVYSFEAKTEYSYINNYKIETRKIRSSVGGSYHFQSRIEHHYATELFYEFDTIKEFRAKVGGEYLQSEKKYSTLSLADDDSLIVDYILSRFEEDNTLSLTGNLRSLYIRKESATGIHEVAESAGIKSYPNPCMLGQKISLESNKLFDEVLVRNHMGLQIFDVKLYPSTTFELSTSQLHTGVIYISLLKEGKPIALPKKQLIIE